MRNSNCSFIGLVLFFIVFIVLYSSCDSNKEDDLNLCSLPTIHWQKGDDIIIEQDFYVDSVVLIIDAGVNVKIKYGCSIIVGSVYSGVIIAKGTSDEPINFETYNPTGNSETSFWGSIDLHNSACDETLSEFEHCNFIKGGGNGFEAVILSWYSGCSFKNCLIDFSKGYGYFLGDNARIFTFENNTLRNTFGHPISIPVKYTYAIGNGNLILSDSVNHGILLRGEYLSLVESVSWKAQTVPYIINDNLNIRNMGSSSLTTIELEEGTKIAFTKDRTLSFKDNTGIVARGTQENPIVFTSSLNSPEAGDWNSIYFWKEGNGQFEFCTFEYGGADPESMVDNGMVVFSSVNGVSFDNCLFQYSMAPAIKLYKPNIIDSPYPSFLVFANNEFKNLNQFSLSLCPQSISSVDYSNEFNNYDIEVLDSDIKEYVLWKNLGADYYTEEYFSVNGENGSTVEFEPGVKIKFNGGGIRTGTAMKWGGRLIAVGTTENPIIFTSASDEPSHGDWAGIKFYTNTAEGCLLDNCNILFAGAQSSNMWKAAVYICCNDSNVTIRNSTIAHSSTGGICVSSEATPTLENNSFLDNLGGNGCDY